MKSFIWIAVITAALIGLMIWGVSGSGSSSISFDPGAVSPLDHVQGNASSSVVIVEYSDFECPACRAYYPVLRELETQYGSQVAFVFRHFPLTSIHTNAAPAAWAAEAAGKQEKFWEMHNLLYEKQDEWADVADIKPMFESYASLLGLSLEQFKKDFASREVKNFVKAQENNAIKLGLQGTPTFFVNGKRLEQNPSSVDAFRAIINSAISAKR